MTRDVWRAGMAALLRGGWPARVVESPDRRGIPVRLLGAAPSAETVVWVGADHLVRPPGARWLDLRPGARRRLLRDPRAWTAEHLRALRALWPLHPAAEIARRVGHSARACGLAMERWWGSRRRRNALVLQGVQVAELLGLRRDGVRALVRAGLLEARRSVLGGGRAGGWWAIERGALERFVREHPEHCDPTLMPPSWCRDLVRGVHAMDPVLTVDEVARARGVHAETVRRAIRRGALAAAWVAVGIGTARGRWMIRRSALAGLLGLARPCRRT